MAPAGSARLELRLLRGFELKREGAKVDLPLGPRRLLAFLALHDRSLARAFVAGELWPESREHKASGKLRTALWQLRQLGGNVVKVTGTRLELAPGVWVDARVLASVTARIVSGRVDLEEARTIDLDDVRGELLPDFWDSWLVLERERMRQLSLHTLEWLCVRLAELGAYSRALLAGLAAVEIEPLRESAQRVLIAAHLAEGNRSEAIAQFERYRELLQLELGLDPSPQLADTVALGEPLTLR